MSRFQNRNEEIFRLQSLYGAIESGIDALLKVASFQNEISQRVNPTVLDETKQGETDQEYLRLQKIRRRVFNSLEVTSKEITATEEVLRNKEKDEAK